jgi:hypothetical protein
LAATAQKYLRQRRGRLLSWRDLCLNSYTALLIDPSLGTYAPTVSCVIYAPKSVKAIFMKFCKNQQWSHLGIIGGVLLLFREVDSGPPW